MELSNNQQIAPTFSTKPMENELEHKVASGGSQWSTATINLLYLLLARANGAQANGAQAVAHQGAQWMSMIEGANGAQQQATTST